MQSVPAIILGDIEIMTILLQMTDCDANKLMQMKIVALLRCEDTLADLFDGVESMQSMEFLQLDAHISPLINKTKFNNPPVPRTEVPMNP